MLRKTRERPRAKLLRIVRPGPLPRRRKDKPLRIRYAERMLGGAPKAPELPHGDARRGEIRRCQRCLSNRWRKRRALDAEKRQFVGHEVSDDLEGHKVPDLEVSHAAENRA